MQRRKFTSGAAAATLLWPLAARAAVGVEAGLGCRARCAYPVGLWVAVALAEKYDAVAAKASGLGLMKREDADVQQYVTGRALDGLYLTTGEHEREIRQNPAANRRRLSGEGLRALSYRPRDSSNIRADGSEWASTSRPTRAIDDPPASDNAYSRPSSTISMKTKPAISLRIS